MGTHHSTPAETSAPGATSPSARADASRRRTELVPPTGEKPEKVTLYAEPEASGVRPAVIRWPYGGRKVYVAGTFNGWSAKIPLSKSGEDFVAILEVPEGAHQYKFIVDGEWRTDPAAPSAVDDHGNINNFLDARDQNRITDELPLEASSPGSDDEYGQEFSEFEENRKNPPLMPPHLQYTPLNHGYRKRVHDPLLLPVPNHVTLNHVYISHTDTVLALGLTHRYRSKFATVILHKPLRDDNNQ